MKAINKLKSEEVLNEHGDGIGWSFFVKNFEVQVIFGDSIYDTEISSYFFKLYKKGVLVGESHCLLSEEYNSWSTFTILDGECADWGAPAEHSIDRFGDYRAITFIDKLSILPKFKRKGYGSFLLNFIEKYFSEYFDSEFSLVFPKKAHQHYENQDSLKNFYRNNGFSIEEGENLNFAYKGN